MVRARDLNAHWEVGLHRAENGRSCPDLLTKKLVNEPGCGEFKVGFEFSRVWDTQTDVQAGL